MKQTNNRMLISIIIPVSIILIIAFITLEVISRASDKDVNKQGFKDKVTFTYFNGAGTAPDINTSETVIGRILEEQTGVNFAIENLRGDLDNKISMMIASNQYPDVLVPDSAIDKVLSANGFIDLKGLIEQYGPNIKRVYEPYYSQLENERGEIFYLPFFNITGERVPDLYIEQGAFWIQRRVLKEAGYPRIRTLEEYFELIRSFIERHPEQDLTGFMALTHDWRIFTITNPPMHLAGYPNDGEVIVDMDTFEAEVYMASDYTKQYLQQLNKLNAEGLFDKSSFINNYDQYLAKLTTGDVLGMFDYAWQIAPAQRALEYAAKLDPSNDDYIYFPLPITFTGGKDQYIDPPNFIRNRGIGITVSAKDPVRIIQYFDHLLKEENQILKSWGIEGETYEIDENGRYYLTNDQIIKINEEYRNSFGFTYYEWNWPQYGRYSSFTDGNAYSPELQPEVFEAKLTEGDKAILDAYGVSNYSEMFSNPDERAWFPAWSISKLQGTPEQIYEAKKIELARKYFPKLVLDDPSQFEEMWLAFTNEFSNLDTTGYEAFMTNEIQKLVEKGSKSK